jgi:4-amino-4-deoxy-L-arabinose transferase-like glycosyltransferase
VRHVATLWKGRAGDSGWVRPALLALLAGTALLYLIRLGASGWANAFYSAAVQAGTQSWKAFFFGSSDAANFITVDKPPMSLWVMGLFARVFGVNSWSILVPQALEGVAAVGVLYATVRRWHGPVAGLLAGAVLALTPAAALMFRFNNPDALLVLLLTLAAWATVRALERADGRWLALAGAFIGCGFLTKMLQAFILVPVVALVYLVAASTSLRRRLWHLLLAGAALVVSSGWWVAIVELWPSASRPYIGGSQTNSVLELVFGYNGLGRMTGNESGAVVPGGNAQAGAWGETGIWRMFGSSWGGQAAWLIPAALALGAALLWLTWRASRTDRIRASVLLWGGWLVVTGLVFSFAQGIIHEYYAVALVPAIGGLVGIGVVELWRRRAQLACRLILAGVIDLSAVWAYILLGRSGEWQSWLQATVLVGGIGAAVLLAAGDRLSRRASLATATAALAVGVLLAGPAAYSLQTASTTHSGSLPTAGPTVAGSRGSPGGMRGGFGGGMPGGAAGTGPGSTQAGMPATGGGMPPLPPGPSQNGGTAAGAFGRSSNGQSGGTAGAGTDGGPQMGSGGAGQAAGGLLNAGTPSAALVALLEQDSGSFTWVAATVGAQSAAGYQLATGDPVMSLGGFNGSDPYPTLEEFKALVQTGKVHYFITSGSTGASSAGRTSGAGGAVTDGTTGGPTMGGTTSGPTMGAPSMGGDGMGGGPGVGTNSSMSAITSWVQSTFASTTVDGVTVYDLSAPTSSL